MTCGFVFWGGFLVGWLDLLFDLCCLSWVFWCFVWFLLVLGLGVWFWFGVVLFVSTWFVVITGCCLCGVCCLRDLVFCFVFVILMWFGLDGFVGGLFGCGLMLVFVVYVFDLVGVFLGFGWVVLFCVWFWWVGGLVCGLV